jgi:hypothetical protein
MRRDESRHLPVIGWREWLKLPDLGVHHIKAKIDTGARSSSLHAFDIEVENRGEENVARFKVHPLQRLTTKVVEIEAKVIEFRDIKSSSGHTDLRPVILTTVTLLGESWPIELTLTDRGAMGFRMLLGREAFRGRFLIDPGNSYYGGKPKKKKKTR